MLNRHTAELLARSSVYMFLIVFVAHIPCGLISSYVNAQSFAVFIGLLEGLFLLAGVMFGATALYHTLIYGMRRILGRALAGIALCTLLLIPILLTLLRSLG